MSISLWGRLKLAWRIIRKKGVIYNVHFILHGDVNVKPGVYMYGSAIEGNGYSMIFDRE